MSGFMKIKLVVLLFIDYVMFKHTVMYLQICHVALKIRTPTIKYTQNYHAGIVINVKSAY